MVYAKHMTFIYDSAEKFLTPGEVARLFHVDPKTVNRWAHQGKITGICTPGGHRRYSEASVLALLNRPGR
jgi:excisionase family DNA binding protein